MSRFHLLSGPCNGRYCQSSPMPLPIDDSDQACLEEVRAVLARYGKLNRFALHLAHRHFPLGPDEILIECPITTGGHSMSPSQTRRLPGCRADHLVVRQRAGIAPIKRGLLRLHEHTPFRRRLRAAWQIRHTIGNPAVGRGYRGSPDFRGKGPIPMRLVGCRPRGTGAQEGTPSRSLARRRYSSRDIMP
jgi:hypothetical protein